MACVTLKRPLDFDPLESLHSPNRPPTKRRRCTPIKGPERDDLELLDIPPPPPPVTVPSIFRESSLDREEISNNLKEEVKRMKRRRQLSSQVERPSEQIGKAGGASSSEQNVTNYHSTASAGSPSGPSLISPASSSQAESGGQSAFAQKSGGDEGSVDRTNSNVPSVRAWMGTRDKPVFTLKQMTLICERMCKERTDLVRQEYDSILQQRLCEQYDAFVKFIDHQIQQRFNQAQLPSYLS